MRRVFADTYYWIALLNAKDQGHARARAVGASLQGAMLVISQEILSEVLTYFSRHGHAVRQSAVTFVRSILSDVTIEVRPQSDATFMAGLTLYESRPDKEYSLTDCISMLAMREAGITEILTHDDHFTQEGFVKLL